MSGSIEYALILACGGARFTGLGRESWLRRKCGADPGEGWSRRGSVQSLEEVQFREVSQGIEGEGLTVRRCHNPGDAEAAGGRSARSIARGVSPSSSSQTM